MNINDTLKYMRAGLPEDILRRKMYGDYTGAIRLIDRRLAEGNLPEALKGSLLVQKKICQELPGEFPYSRDEALAIIRKDIPDFTDAEFQEQVDRSLTNIQPTMTDISAHSIPIWILQRSGRLVFVRLRL